jgi:G3E family GTPase
LKTLTTLKISKHLNTLVFVGPPGSGKTSLASATFRSGKLVGRKIYIINDDGDGSEGTVDAGILRGIEGLDLNALTAGCIGCKDEADFREALRRIQVEGNIDWLVIEPVGYAAGNEVPIILKSVGIQATVICLVDVANFVDNLVDGFMPTQVKAATVVGLTKYGEVESLEDPRLEEVLAFIGEHNSKAEVFMVPPGATLPEWILEHQHEDNHKRHDHHEGCGHDHNDRHHASEHHRHEHDHSDEHHGVFTIHLKLRPEVRYGDLQRLISVIPGIFRGKGVVEGWQWHLVQRTWSPEEFKDDRPAFATLYAREPLAKEDFVSIATPNEDLYAGKDIKQIMRTSHVSVEQTEAAIHRHLGKFPAKAFVNRFGDLVTHPEILSITKELARRGGVAAEVFAGVIRACVRYWLSAAELLNSRDLKGNPSYAEWQRALGTSLGYFGYHHRTELGVELIAQIVSANPARLLFTGLREVTSLNSDFAKAKMQADEARDIAKFGLVYGGITKEQILLVSLSCQNLARETGRDDIVLEWAASITEIEGFDFRIAD